MHHNIRTKAHKVMPLFDSGAVFFTAPSKDDNKDPEPHDLAPPVKHFGFNFAQFRPYLEKIVSFPKFVIDPELQEMSNDHELGKSIVDMKRAGKLRMPYPQMLVELPHNNGFGQHLVFVQDGPSLRANTTQYLDEEALYADPRFDFYTYLLHVAHDFEGEYLVISPSLIGLTIGDLDKDDELQLSLTAMPIHYGCDKDTITKHSQRTWQKDAGMSWRGVFAATMLMATRGTKREVIECDKLNKARTRSGKPSIPKHTYVTIGHVYRSAKSEQSDTYVKGKSPRPHWRRGHIARWRTGPIKSEDRGWGEKWVDSRLVALAADAHVPAPEYHVVK